MTESLPFSGMMLLKPVQGRPVSVWLLSSISTALLENPVTMVICTTANNLLLNDWSYTLFSKSGIYGLMVQQKANRSMVLFPTERFLISSLSSWNLRRLNRLCLNLAGSIFTLPPQIKYCINWYSWIGTLIFDSLWRQWKRNKPNNSWVFEKKRKLTYREWTPLPQSDTPARSPSSAQTHPAGHPPASWSFDSNSHCLRR